ncbi:nitroreductase [Arthrobacter oryzae]|uniref:M50 family metallopeptidase n=1 Tax=Arthrobacter TaxID=1663 RepID=UPI001F21E670|nr:MULTISPECIES: M50 family metallopeptidase [Arthrobacter]MDP9988184.1 nitroreductase [Arthrobacter oryzae]UKA69230.1 M50 family metallopeptidase [Arthrobacter sp. FW306-06-A]
MDSPASLWSAFSAAFTQTNVPTVTWVELLLSLAAAVALSIPRRSWRYFGLLATATHELGHAFAAVTSGQRLAGIRLRLDHSGTTTTYSRSRLAAAWSCFWGYPVPAMVGAAFVWCGLSGWGPAAMAATALVLATSLVFLRNLAGFAITASAIAGTAALAFLAPGPVVGHVTVVLGMALLVAGVRDLLKLTNVHLRRRDRLGSSDAYLLYRATSVPSGIWIALFSLIVAGAWLVAWQPISVILLKGP